MASMSPVRSHRKSVYLAVLTVFLAMFAGNATANAQVVSFGGARPFKLFIPSTYNASFRAPLIIALHGFAQSGAKFEKYLNLTPIAEARGILYVHPDGSADKTGTRFWNATPECCDYHSPKVNDDAYLMSIIDQVSKNYAVDPERIYIIGHSNGGFMANRMACKHADVIAAVISLAGGSFANTSQCRPASPINVLEIWGTKDVTYKGNHMMGKFIQGAAKTAATWGAIDHCFKDMTVLADKLDLDAKQKGPETTVGQYYGCSGNADVEFWKIAGADHVPNPSPNFVSALVDFLLAHPKVIASPSG
jgi:polyhydroxybutyrate depolymerase